MWICLFPSFGAGHVSAGLHNHIPTPKRPCTASSSSSGLYLRYLALLLVENGSREYLQPSQGERTGGIRGEGRGKKKSQEREGRKGGSERAAVEQQNAYLSKKVT